MQRLYEYVGSRRALEASAGQARGAPIRSRAGLAAWLAANPDARREGATYVVDRHDVLRLAPRRSEHVACAGEPCVRAAGEMEFARDGGAVTRVSNQSSGFCPETHTFALVRERLEAAHVGCPEELDPACLWRRCERCGQTVLVKDEDFSCPCCPAVLPRAWNFALTPSLPSPLGRLLTLRRLRHSELLDDVRSNPWLAPLRQDAPRFREPLGWLVRNATPAGRVLAAHLLHHVDPAEARAAWEWLRDGESAVPIHWHSHGCGSIDTRPIAAWAKLALATGDAPAEEYPVLRVDRAAARSGP